jgi:hypothetical protein
MNHLRLTGNKYQVILKLRGYIAPQFFNSFKGSKKGKQKFFKNRFYCKSYKNLMQKEKECKDQLQIPCCPVLKTC